MFYGTSNSESGNNLYGTVNIPTNQPTGWYDLEVYDNNTNNWVLLNNAFEVLYQPAEIHYITPNHGDQGQSLSDTISGTNINYGSQ